jgi:hypothetical protein
MLIIDGKYEHKGGWILAMKKVYLHELYFFVFLFLPQDGYYQATCVAD